jgi:hypothetical protein
MTHKDMFDEIRLNTFVKRLGLSIDEVEHALSLYAHNKRFDKELDEYYNVDNDTIDEDWDDWHPNDL